MSYLGALFPAAWAEPEVLERARGCWADLGPEEVQLRRHLLELCDDLERTIRVRAYAEAARPDSESGRRCRLPLSGSLWRPQAADHDVTTCTGPR